MGKKSIVRVCYTTPVFRYVEPTFRYERDFPEYNFWESEVVVDERFRIGYIHRNGSDLNRISLYTGSCIGNLSPLKMPELGVDEIIKMSQEETASRVLSLVAQHITKSYITDETKLIRREISRFKEGGYLEDQEKLEEIVTFSDWTKMTRKETYQMMKDSLSWWNKLRSNVNANLPIEAI